MAWCVQSKSPMQNYTRETESLQASAKNPLENLMLHQLHQLISGERLLEKRYAQLGASGDSNHDIAQFEAEMMQLESRADRLSRMIEAMSENALV
jgi:hypothetical protein